MLDWFLIVLFGWLGWLRRLVVLLIIGWLVLLLLLVVYFGFVRFLVGLFLWWRMCGCAMVCLFGWVVMHGLFVGGLH